MLSISPLPILIVTWVVDSRFGNLQTNFLSNAILFLNNNINTIFHQPLATSSPNTLITGVLGFASITNVVFIELLVSRLHLVSLLVVVFTYLYWDLAFVAFACNPLRFPYSGCQLRGRIYLTSQSLRDTSSIYCANNSRTNGSRGCLCQLIYLETFPPTSTMNWATVAPETRLYKGKNLYRWELSPGVRTCSSISSVCFF